MLSIYKIRLERKNGGWKNSKKAVSVEWKWKQMEEEMYENDREEWITSGVGDDASISEVLKESISSKL